MLLKFWLIDSTLLLTIRLLIFLRLRVRWIHKLITSTIYILCRHSSSFWSISWFHIYICLKNVVDLIPFGIIKIFLYVIFIKIINLINFFYDAWTLIFWLRFCFLCVFNKRSIKKWKNFLTKGNNFFKNFMKKSDIFLILSVIRFDEEIAWKINIMNYLSIIK